MKGKEGVLVDIIDAYRDAADLLESVLANKKTPQEAMKKDIWYFDGNEIAFALVEANYLEREDIDD